MQHFWFQLLVVFRATNGLLMFKDAIQSFSEMPFD
uniref:Uncharacterized protein n=1 Tax=Rhizophora mucronata TaxID=61149 RepID=A0A2P2IHA3_RHIMU